MVDHCGDHVGGKGKPESVFLRNKPSNGRVDRASATKAVDFGSIPGRTKPETYKNWYFQLPCLTLSD